MIRECLKKHAYLIMAHNNFNILDKLLRLLDDSRNDIYLHIDRKVKDFDFCAFKRICREANVYFLSNRISIQWGTQSQVLTELLLYKTAYDNGPYHYYHLISGVDLPLKTQDEIHAFFADKTVSFLHYKENTSLYNYQRVSRYWNVFSGKGQLADRLNAYTNILQEKLGVDRLKHSGLVVKKGYNWASLTHEAVEILLSSTRKIHKLTRFSMCADEVYKQTMLLAMGYTDIVNDDLRFVDWSAGGNHPHVFTVADFERLIHSDKLFARKFDEKTDRAIVDKIYDHVMSQQKAGNNHENRNCNSL